MSPAKKFPFIERKHCVKAHNYCPRLSEWTHNPSSLWWAKRFIIALLSRLCAGAAFFILFTAHYTSNNKNNIMSDIQHLYELLFGPIIICCPYHPPSCIWKALLLIFPSVIYRFRNKFSWKIDFWFHAPIKAYFLNGNVCVDMVPHIDTRLRAVYCHCSDVPLFARTQWRNIFLWHFPR